MSLDLSGTSGKLKKLLNRITNSTKPLTDERVENLDTIPTIESDTNTIKNRIPSDNATHINRIDANVSSRLASVFGATKVQTGYVSTGVTSPPQSGSGEDFKFLDVTISSVTDTSKAIVIVDQVQAFRDNGAPVFPVTGRLTSSTNLRIAGKSNTADVTNFLGRWYVVELK